MRLHPALDASLRRLPFERPTAIQAHVVPLLSARHDVMASGQTGSGKTLMFLLPVLNLLLEWGVGQRNSRQQRDVVAPSALVLAPTRELATQIFDEAAKLCRNTGITPALAYGGADVGKQLRQMFQGCDLLIATPGRLQMFVDQRKVNVRQVAALVVDEADRMLDMGFEPQLTAAVRALGPPPSGTGRVALMCSATFPLDIQRLAARFLNDRYIFVTVGRVGAAVDSIEQTLLWADEEEKRQAVLAALEGRPRNSRTLVFCNTKSSCEQLADDLRGTGWRNAEALHGDRTQRDRERVLEAFRNGRTTVLVATDVAARGLDISGVEHVVQFDTATDSDDYVHRIGRTGRAGAKGAATALINGRQLPASPSLVRILADAGQAVPLWLHGMSHVARARSQEQRDAIEAGGGGLERGEEAPADAAPQDSAFGGQDFRRDAAAGSWGKERDLSFANFEEDAYRESASQDESDVEGDAEVDGGFDSSVEPEEQEDDTDEQSFGVAASAKEDEAKTEAPRAPAEADEPWQPPAPPSPELRRELERSRPRARGGDLVGDAPEPQLLRQLQQQRSQRLYFEYLGLFSPQAVADALSGPTSREAARLEGLRRVLMVAEKPSIAEAIAKALSPPNRRNGPRKVRGVSRAIPLFEFAAKHMCADGVERQCAIRVTSTVGHIFSLKFDEKKEEGVDQRQRRRPQPREFFEIPVVKQVEETSDKLRVVEHLRAAAAGCDELCLWLDCDREGENIAHEVMAVTRSVFPDVQQQVRRARFSSLAPAELRVAARELPKHLPDAAVSRSVDARQELDLRAGVAFSRQLTATCVNIARQKLGSREGPQLRLISWGPCQSPTLWFVCQRYQEVASFRPRPLFSVTSSVSDPSTGRRLTLSWVPPKELQLAAEPSAGDDGSEAEAPPDARRPRRREERGATFDGDAARGLLRKVKWGDEAVVTDVSLKERSLPAPAGLNTVGLLQACSKALGVSPKKAMQVAEKLYSSGFISYPRTETTKYSKGFDVVEALQGHARHPAWGRSAERQLRQLRRGWRPPPVGRDVGDHPPITPIRPATREEVGGGLEWRIYEFISRHFLGSLSEPVRYRSVVSQIEVEGSGCLFEHSEVVVDEPGFGGAMPWILSSLGAGERQEANYSPLTRGTRLRLDRVDLAESMTAPPPFLQEHELIGLMDKHGIGTDASMATHVATICDRNYVAVVDEDGEPLRPPGKPGSKQRQQPRQRGRFLVPTSLGLAFLEAVENIEPDLVSPPIRAKMEAEVAKIADSGLDKDEVLGRNLKFFSDKFGRFIQEKGEIQDYLEQALEPTQTHLERLRRQGCFGDATPSSHSRAGSPRQDDRRRGGGPMGRAQSSRPSDRRDRGRNARDMGRPQRRPASDPPPSSRFRGRAREPPPSSDFDRRGGWGDDNRNRARPPPSSDFDRRGGWDDDNRNRARPSGGNRGYREDRQRSWTPEPRPKPDVDRHHSFDGGWNRGPPGRGGEEEDLDMQQWGAPGGQPQLPPSLGGEPELPPSMAPDNRHPSRRKSDRIEQGRGEYSFEEEMDGWLMPEPTPPRRGSAAGRGRSDDRSEEDRPSRGRPDGRRDRPPSVEELGQNEDRAARWKRRRQAETGARR